jgi:hypothetical protein
MKRPLQRVNARARRHAAAFGRAAVVLLGAVLIAACQTTTPIEQADATIETTSINVDPAPNGSTELEGQVVSGTIHVSIPAEGWMRDVRFFLDDVLVKKLASAPYEITVDTTTLADGPHTIGVEARGANNKVRISKVVTFVVSNAPLAPGLPALPETPDPDLDLEPDPDHGADPGGDPDAGPDPDPNERDSGSGGSPAPEPEPEPEPSPPPAPSPPTAPSPPPESSPAPAPAPIPPPTSPVVSDYTMRGNPSFSRSLLTAQQRTHYDRLWQEISDPANRKKIMDYARSDDIFAYGRYLGSYVQVVLTAFRMSGDLALLDLVDEIAELMRAELRDGWRSTLDGTDGTKDGFLNWVDRYEPSSKLRGKDLTQINEMRTHATVATIAYALHLNRDLPSPAGRNYGAHADFWRDYLVNHFEAKWRTRTGIKTAFPFMGRPHTTEYYNWMIWHYYMGRLTGKNAYLVEANRMADHLWGELRTVNTATGPAYVWARSIGSLGGSQAHVLQPSTYARHTFGDIVELHLEGFHNWASGEHMRRFARTFTAFIIDTNDPIKNGFAPDVGGGVPRAGLDPGSTTRMSASMFRDTQFALISPWDDSGVIASLADAIQAKYASSDTVRLASSLFITTTYHGSPLAPTMALASAP